MIKFNHFKTTLNIYNIQYTSNILYMYNIKLISIISRGEYKNRGL